MSSVRKLAGQTAIYGLSSIVGRVLNFGLTFVYVDVLVPGEFGMYSDLYAKLSYALIILTFGMETAFFRFAKKHLPSPEAFAAALYTVWGLSLFVGGVALWQAGGLAGVLGYPGYIQLARLVVGIVLLDALAALPLARLRYREKALRFAGISLFTVLLTIGLNIYLLYVLGMGLEAIFLANLIASAARLLLACLGNMPRRLPFKRASWRAMAGYGALIMLTGLFGMLNEMLDRNLIPLFWPDGALFNGIPRTGLELNGMYSANYKLGVIIVLATQAFRYAAEPFFFKEAGGARSPELFAKIYHYFMLAALAAFVLVSAFAKELVAFTFFGLKSGPLLPRTYWPATEVVPLILLANVALGAYINLSIWYKITAQLRFGLWFALAGTVATVAINVVFIPLYGYWAAAWAHVVCYGLMALLSYAYGQRHYHIPYRMGRFALYLLIAALAAWASHYLLPRAVAFSTWGLKLAICLGAAALIYLAERRAPVFPTKPA